MTVRILEGDCRAVLKTMPDESVHCIVTSPPYFGLRDYGTASWSGGDPECDHKQGRPGAGRADGVVDDRAQRNRDGVGSMGGDCRRCGAVRIDQQIGLEGSPAEFVEQLVSVFREARRVLRADGTLWLNLGDSYNAAGRNGQGSRAAHFKQGTNRASATGADDCRPTDQRLKPKDLLGIPWRVAFALQDDGWWLRQDIIWAKPNPMPESVSDRCTKAHEYLFLLAKDERYYFDAEAIQEAAVKTGTPGHLTPGGGSYQNVRHSPMGRSGNKQRKPPTERGAPVGGNGAVAGSVPWEGQSRNKRSVWTVPVRPFMGAHFATFPPDLIEPCVLAGCPEGGTVLDPFGGAGTTGLVADRTKRNAVLIELNPEYADMARRRIKGDAPLFADAS